MLRHEGQLCRQRSADVGGRLLFRNRIDSLAQRSSSEDASRLI